MRSILLIGFAALAVFGASSSVASSDMVPASALTGKMMQVQYLIGTWSCTTKVSAAGKMAAHTETGKNIFWIEPGNTIGNYYSSKGYSASGYIGWMTSKNLWWSSSADRIGGIGLETGKDTSTKVQLMTGTEWFQGQPSPSRDTITKNSDTSFRDVFEMKTNGSWSGVADSSCAKTSNKTM